MIHNDVYQQCNILTQDIVGEWSLYKQTGSSDVYRASGVHKNYLLKTPNNTVNIYTLDQVIQSYYSAHGFYTMTSISNNIMSYGIIVMKNTVYHLMECIDGTQKDFINYSDDDIILLAQHIATLHAVPISAQYSNPLYIPIFRRRLFFGNKSVSELYDKQKHISNATLLGKIVDSFYAYYKNNRYDPNNHCTLIHGDLHASNIMIYRQGVCMIDPCDIQYGNPVLDVGAVLLGIELAYVKHEKIGYQHQQKLFIDTYLSISSRDKEFLQDLPLVFNHYIGQILTLTNNDVFIRYKSLGTHIKNLLFLT